LATAQKDLSLVVQNNQTTDNVKLEVIKDINALRISENSSYALNLGDYFANADHYSFEASNLTATFNGNILNISANDGFRGARKGKVIAYLGNQKIESNSFDILVSSGAIKIRTSHNDIRVGELVKWTKNITLESPEQISIQVPVEAENISVAKLADNTHQNVPISTSALTGNVVIEIEVSKKKVGLFDAISKIFSVMTGHVVSDMANIQQETPVGQQTRDITINDTSSTDYTVQYYTEAPEANEKNITLGKEVTISSKVEGYTDVLSFANIPELYKVGEESKIKIFWKQGNKYVSFDAYDLDGNGKLDYVEWNTPHLSNQTFEIILVSQASELDSSRNFVRDVYDKVKSQDNNFVDIMNGNYIRAIFEKNLTLGKDMTVYARGTGTIEVYNVNSNDLIGQLNIAGEKSYKIYPNYTNSDVYDLRFLGNISVDFIVDPPGCMDPGAYNYDPYATSDNYWAYSSDDYRCYYIPGCTDSGASNYNPSADINDGSCSYEVMGCTDSNANNYNPAANIDDGSCHGTPTPIPGCMDPYSYDYNPYANVDSGSCGYSNPFRGCTNPVAYNYWNQANTDDGSCDLNGCVDPAANNYHNEARDACNYDVYGCTHGSPTAAKNYNPAATVDDGSCQYYSWGCTDSNARNYDPNADYGYTYPCDRYTDGRE
ncbi:MAG: hypothetical protein WCK29_04310, partial [archaeon]